MGVVISFSFTSHLLLVCRETVKRYWFCTFLTSGPECLTLSRPFYNGLGAVARGLLGGPSPGLWAAARGLLGSAFPGALGCSLRPPGRPFPGALGSGPWAPTRHFPHGLRPAAFWAAVSPELSPAWLWGRLHQTLAVGGRGRVFSGRGFRGLPRLLPGLVCGWRGGAAPTAP